MQLLLSVNDFMAELSLFLSLSISLSLLCLEKTRRKEFFPIGIEYVSKIHNVVLERGQFN